MRKDLQLGIVLCALCLVLDGLQAGAQAPAAPLTREAQAEFLRSARIVKATPTGKGVTQPFRLTLSDGTLTHDAAFQSIDVQKQISQSTGKGRRPEFNFMDSWRFNVAAPRVAEMLGIGHMVPVSVERAWNGKQGAITWWVDDVLMDEEERRKANAEAPDRETWNRQMITMRVFTQLTHDTDRNQGNLLITRDWQLVMIDFTRAFRAWHETPAPVTTLRRCDRAVLAAMRELTKPGVQSAAGKYLTAHEVEALLARRDIIVKHFDGLIAQLGEANVLF
jgi:hypothetical protein